MSILDRFTSSVARVRSAAIVLGLLLIATVAALVWNNIRATAAREDAARWERHTFVVLVEAERLRARLRGAESGVRGYLLSSDVGFLSDYRRSVVRAEYTLKRLIELTRDNPAQHRNVIALRALIGERLRIMRANAAMASGGGIVAADSLIDGRQAMLTAIAQIDRVRSVEEDLLGRRRAAADAAGAEASRATYALSVVGAALLALTGLAGSTALGSISRSRLAVETAKVEAGLRLELEKRVADRTRDLKAANFALIEEGRAREAAEASVRQMQRIESIGQLTGGIAHDFNNMLAIVIGSLDMARRKFNTDPDRARTYIDNAEEGARRAAELTARLLAFSRQQPLAPEPIDANKFVAGMSELLRRTISEAVRVETVLAGGLWRAHVDPGQLENAIVNLAVNARDAMGEAGGKLTIETANTHLDEAYAADHAEVTAGQYVVICVTDTGEGMPAEVIERAFDPFFTTKAVGKGTGLGLSQVFGFVKQSGGHIKIYSEPGVGTTVKLYLPRWFGGDATAEPVRASTEMPRGRADEIILVVEDEQRVRHLSVDTLRELGYTVVQASDAAEALEQLRMQPRIDLLFTDIVMPDMNGRELADRARADRPELRVLYTTGYTRNAVVHNGMVDPGVAFLTKPFSIDQLARRVRAVLDT